MTWEVSATISHAESGDEHTELISEPERGGLHSPCSARLAVGLLVASALVGGACFATPGRARDASLVSLWAFFTAESVQLEEDMDLDATSPCTVRRLSGTSADVWSGTNADPCTLPGATPICPGMYEDCTTAQCCSLPGSQCYAKEEGWAQCLASCNPGPQPFDVDGEHWSCDKLGDRSAGNPLQCAVASENCMAAKCCSHAGMACFAKNETFGTCMNFCVAGPQYTDDDWKPWTCEQLGQFTPSKGEWVEEECAGDLDDCKESKCCKTSDYQCYERDKDFAQCLPECVTEWLQDALPFFPDLNTSEMESWTCKELGSRTPPHAAAVTGKVSPWVEDRCSKSWWEDCSESRCCSDVGMQCFERDEFWAACKDSCEPGRDEQNKMWSCNTLGPRLSGLALKGFPSLLCFAVFRLGSYELPIIRHQYEKRTGIFECDQALLFADKPVEFNGTKVLLTPNVTIGTTIDGTAGNTELFLQVWNDLLDEGSYQNHDWTIKVDPDAVMLTDRLRIRLAPHTQSGSRIFVVNCNAWPGQPTFPLMYGALEVFSSKALEAYARGVDGCRADLPWRNWSEDTFLTRCMEQTNVWALRDFDMVGDKICVGPGQIFRGDCNDPDKAAFHPFKDIDSWTECWRNATDR